jgi:hypothetical protein
MTVFFRKQKDILIFVPLLLGLTVWPKLSSSQTVLTQQQASSVLSIDKIAVQDGAVTGEVRNNSKNTVRDVRLFIRYTFLWKDEFHPGKESPSAAFYHTVSGEIAPGKLLPFKFTPAPPLPQCSNGRFERSTVSIAAFTEIIPQK